MIKTKLLLITLILCLFSALSFGQSIQLFDENFETGGPTFTINGTGVGSNTGNNLWTVNNNYVGMPFYPNTISEDSTYSGTISYAPYGHYLHIFDTTNTTVSNSNYNPNNQSDRFAYMTTGVCTMGMNPINVTFFYNCQGSSTAYGKVFYSINNGPWVQTGQAQYNNH